jgi:hypothetical protein
MFHACKQDNTLYNILKSREDSENVFIINLIYFIQLSAVLTKKGIFKNAYFIFIFMK